MTCFLKHSQLKITVFFFASLTAFDFHLPQLSAKTATVARFIKEFQVQRQKSSSGSDAVRRLSNFLLNAHACMFGVIVL
jgi:hypothetical protein